MAAELPRPGVEVIQVFRSVSPTVITPTLVPCVVGVCRQVVEVLQTNDAGSQELNNDSIVPLQANFVALAASGDPPKYTGLDGLDLVFSVNGGPDITVTFDGSSISPSGIVAQVRNALADAANTTATAETVDDDSWRLRTLAADDNQTIEIKSTTSTTVAAAFGIGIGRTYSGATYYSQRELVLPTASFPNPRNNLAQLAFDNDTIRAFMYLGGSGGSLVEMKRDRSFLRYALATAAIRTGNVDISGLTFLTAAVRTGTTDVTAGGLYTGGGTLHGLTLILNVNGAGLTTLTLNGATNTADLAALLAAIHVQWPTITATQGGPGGNKLVLTDSVLGTAGTITVGGGTANAALGLTANTVTGGDGDLDGLTLELAINGGSTLTTTFDAPTDAADVASQINDTIGLVATASIVAGSSFLRITTLRRGVEFSIQVVGGSGMTTVGLTANTVTGTDAVQAVDDGNGDAITPILNFPGQDFSAAGTAAVVTGTVDITAGLTDDLTLIIDDGTGPQTITFSGANSSVLVLSQINKVVGPAAGGHITATVNGSVYLVLTDNRTGVESKISVSGTALTGVGMDEGTTYGGAMPARVGDQLYVDGVFYATITQVAPGGTASRLKIDRQVPISLDVGNSFYIIALNLPDASDPTLRPTPDLQVGLDGSVTIKLDLLRDTTGAPIGASRAQVAMAYKAVRKDVTAVAPRAALLRFNNTIALGDQLAPINADNPLALGLYFALLNAPGTQVTGLGVDASSGSAPEGTVEAFTRAATFLEAYEVYAVAPMTNDRSVGQVFALHATVMSKAENKGERVALFAPAQPSAKNDTLIASGLAGNSTGTLNDFDTGVSNLGALLLAAGLNPVGSFLVEDGVFLDTGDGAHYSITSIAGGIVTIKVSFLSGENDDGFYSTDDLSSELIGQAFAIRVRGASLTLTDGTLDKEALAVTYQGMAQTFLNRRFWHIIAPQVAATLGGLETLLPGYYACAGVAGMIGRQPPQQSFTNFPMTGFTRVIGTNGFLTERQLDVVAAGGNYIIVQDEESSPLISRMALTTDVTSVETRTDSITKVVDFCAKFLRRGLKNFIGRFNITQGFLDSLGHVIQGLLGFLSESGVLIGSHLNNIVQDENAPDTVLIDITLDVPFPCNYMRLTLVV